jgi:hypothetical protein
VSAVPPAAARGPTRTRAQGKNGPGPSVFPKEQRQLRTGPKSCKRTPQTVPARRAHPTSAQRSPRGKANGPRTRRKSRTRWLQQRRVIQREAPAPQKRQQVTEPQERLSPSSVGPQG